MQVDNQIIDPYKAPEQLKAEIMLELHKREIEEAHQRRMQAGEQQIIKDLTTLITSLKNIIQMSPEDVAANAYEFTMLSYCELWYLSTDPIPTRVRLKAAQVLEEVYQEIGKTEGREATLALLQAEVTNHEFLWKRIQELCQLSPDGVYKADWDQFFVDTNGFTINSLASYNLLSKLDIYLEDYKTYHIKIKEGQA